MAHGCASRQRDRAELTSRQSTHGIAFLHVSSAQNPAARRLKGLGSAM
jgi:hypothetical protein